MSKWLRFSGINVTLIVNPLQWCWLPWANRFQDEWSGPARQTINFGWLFVMIKIWVDDGSW